MPDITVGQAGIYAILGYAIVFIGLFALMLVISLLGKLLHRKKRKKHLLHPKLPRWHLLLPPVPQVS